MQNTLIKQYSIAGKLVSCRGKRGQEQLCLTDIWKAAGRTVGKQPWEWLRHDDTQEFVALQCRILNLVQDQVIDTKKGRYGGTWAYWAVAIKYAAYLNKTLEDNILQAWRQLKEEARERLHKENVRGTVYASYPGRLQFPYRGHKLAPWSTGQFPQHSEIRRQ